MNGNQNMVCIRSISMFLHTTEIMDKLSKHEIDCFVSVEEPRWEESEISPITSIGETEIYFAINPRTSGYQRSTG